MNEYNFLMFRIIDTVLSVKCFYINIVYE